MKHLKPFNENFVPTYSKEQIKEIAKRYVDFNILNDLIHLCTEYNDTGREIGINVYLMCNFFYKVYNNTKGWESYDSNTQYAIRDMLTQFLQRDGEVKAIKYSISVFYKYSVNKFRNPSFDEAEKIVNSLVDKIKSKYPNLRFTEMQEGFMSTEDENPSAYIEIYKDL